MFKERYSANHKELYENSQLSPIYSGLIDVLDYNIVNGHPEDLGLSLCRYIQCNPESFKHEFVHKLGAVVQHLYSERPGSNQLTPEDSLQSSNIRALILLCQLINYTNEDLEIFLKYFDSSNASAADRYMFQSDAAGCYWICGGSVAGTSIILNHALDEADDEQQARINRNFVIQLGDSLTPSKYRSAELLAELLDVVPMSTRNTFGFDNLLARLEKLAARDNPANTIEYFNHDSTLNGIETTAAPLDIDTGWLFLEYAQTGMAGSVTSAVER